MKDNLNIYFDEEGDFLELNIGGFTKGHFKNCGNGIFERIEDGNIKGIAIMGFRARSKTLGSLHIPLPVRMKLSS